MNKLVLIIGIVLVALGIISGLYKTEEKQLFGLVTTTQTPYEAYLIPLLIGGIILIIVGAVLKKEK
jgi:hypothetical protein